MLYQIKFEDGSIFQGGNLENSKWNEMPDKPIESVEYYLLTNKVVLENYEAYNHLVERVSLMDGRMFISKVILLGKSQNKVLSVVFDFMKEKVYGLNSEFGYEYNGKAVSGWKAGVLNKIPKFTHY